MSYLKLWERFWVTDLWSKGCQLGAISVDFDKCIGCGLCVKVCPGDSLELDKDKHPHAKANAAELSCASCGACQACCPKEAITITNAMSFEGMFKTLRRGPLSYPRLFKELEIKK